MIPYLAKWRAWFAEANRWRESKWFSYALLASGKMYSRNWQWHEGRPLDHASCFRINRWPVAIVGHNYDHDEEDLHNIIKQFKGGLRLHTAPSKAASWYYPGVTTLLVITQPSLNTIIWPGSKQIAEMAADHDAYVKAREDADIRRKERRERMARLHQ